MAPKEYQGRDPAPAAAPATSLRRQLSYSGSIGRCEPMHERKLSYSYSFSTASPSCSSTASTKYHDPMSSSSSGKLSCDSIVLPADLVEKRSSFSSESSYESLFHLDAADLDSHQPEFVSTKPPAAQTMTAAQGKHGAGGYDPKRLPSAMFRTRSTSPGEWSATSNDSLFSIQLSQSASGDLGDLYFDANGVFHRLPSTSSKLPAVSELAHASGGGLCVDDCGRRSTTAGNGKNRKSVRFAATECVSGDNKPAFPTSLTHEMDEAEEAEPPEIEAKTPGTETTGWWCSSGFCSSSAPSLWWPLCACGGCGLFRCGGGYCRC